MHKRRPAEKAAQRTHAARTKRARNSWWSSSRVMRDTGALRGSAVAAMRTNAPTGGPRRYVAEQSHAMLLSPWCQDEAPRRNAMLSSSQEQQQYGNSNNKTLYRPRWLILFEMCVCFSCAHLGRRRPPVTSQLERRHPVRLRLGWP